MQVVGQKDFSYKGHDFSVKVLTDGFNTFFEVFDMQEKTIVFKDTNYEGQIEKWKLSGSFPWRVRNDALFSGHNPNDFEEMIVQNLKTRVHEGIDRKIITNYQ